MNKTYANGIFLFIALIIFGIMIFYVDDFALLREKKHIYVLFDHIDALADGALVYYNGVNVGSVRGIEFWDRKIKVRLSFKQDIALHENMIIKIKTGGLVGEKYIDISSPAGKAGKLLNSGETLPGLTGESFDSLINTFNKLATEMNYSFKKINNILDKSEANINRIFENTEKSTAKIPEMLLSFENEIKQIGNEVELLLGNFNKDFSSVGPELKNSIISFRNVMDRLQSILEVVDKRKNSVGESIDNIEGITENVLNISRRINSFVGDEGDSFSSLITPFDRENTVAEFGMSYSNKDDKIYSDVLVKFLKKDLNFLEVGIERIGYENDFKFILSRHYSPGKYMFGGIISSRPGMGFGFLLKNSAVELYNSDINEDFFNLKFDYSIDKNITFGVKYLDIKDKKDFEFFLKRKM